jgi:predicted dehydrogenase
MLVAGCHALDALRWFAGEGEFEAANPVEVFAFAGGYRKNRTEEYNPFRNTWVKGVPAMEYDGLEMALVKFDNGVLGKVSVNFDCITPYRFPIRIFGDRGTAFDNRLWSPRKSAPAKWIELPDLQPDSSDVSHHPFQAEIDHFVECLQKGVESHCNLDDAIRTHEIVFAALKCYQTRRPVRLPLLKEPSRA